MEAAVRWRHTGPDMGLIAGGFPVGTIPATKAACGSRMTIIFIACGHPRCDGLDD
jgi:hypothetical protein